VVLGEGGMDEEEVYVIMSFIIEFEYHPDLF